MHHDISSLNRLKFIRYRTKTGLFDAVLANHMLYYVPDKSTALTEVKRVLKADGRFFTSTVGEKHMQELECWVKQFIGRKTHLFNDEIDSFGWKTVSKY